MKYKVWMTRRAQIDLQGAADYISFELFSPAAAEKLLDDFSEKTRELAEYPEGYALVTDSVLRSWGIRSITVSNYLILYTVHKDTVFIVRFLHQRRDWIRLLRDEEKTHDEE
jgi:addiction module RelE/StbE family toxin